MDFKKLYDSFLEKQRKTALSEKLENGYVVKPGPGHTWATNNCATVHPVVQTSLYYVSAKLTGIIDRDEALEILKAIEKCQVSGKGTREDGNFLWFAEETRIQDFNAAFFIISPLLKLRILKPEILSEEETKLIDKMLLVSLTWFETFAKTAEMYYPNPTVSNLSCLYCIAAITKDCEKLAKAQATLKKYIDYTENRGWGWGESISPSYIMELISPSKLIAVISKRIGDTYICEKFTKLLDELLDFVRFQGNVEWVPTIRNYNISGKPENACGAKIIAGVTDDTSKASFNLLNTLLFKEELENYDENHKKCEKYEKKDLFVKKIFDDATATTWKGKGIHLGTVSEYPFMPSNLQNPTWGNGWQAMPVAFAVENKQLAFLRWEVTTKDRRRCFPHETRLFPNDINAALFDEKWYPDMYTVAAQNKNIAVVLRRMNGLHNSANEIVDEFAVARFDGKAEKYEKDGREWVVLTYPGKATVFIGAGDGITLHTDGTEAKAPECVSILGGDHDPELDNIKRDGTRTPQKLIVGKHTSPAKQIVDGSGLNPDYTEYLTVSQILYKGDEKRLDYRALEVSWAIITLDYEVEDPEKFLETVKFTAESIHDFEVPRWHDTRICTMRLEADGKAVELRHDPVNDRKAMY